MISYIIFATTFYGVIGGHTISYIIFATTFYGVIEGCTISCIIFAESTQYHMEFFLALFVV
jgi:hypothetical protein